MLRYVVGTVPDEFMVCVSVVLRDNGVFEENGPTDPTERHFTPHFNCDVMKGSFVGCMGLFRLPYASV
jgi:hypothetical protein